MVLVGFKPDLWRPTGFLQCFDTVGLVIWPVRIVPKTTYNVLSGTLSLFATITVLVVTTSYFICVLHKHWNNFEIIVFTCNHGNACIICSLYENSEHNRRIIEHYITIDNDNRFVFSLMFLLSSPTLSDIFLTNSAQYRKHDIYCHRYHHHHLFVPIVIDNSWQ